MSQWPMSTPHGPHPTMPTPFCQWQIRNWDTLLVSLYAHSQLQATPSLIPDQFGATSKFIRIRMPSSARSQNRPVYSVSLYTYSR